MKLNTVSNRLLALIAGVTAVVGLGLYSLLGVGPLNCVIARLSAEMPTVASIMAAFAFTVAGFLGTTITFILAFGNTDAFRFFTEDGHTRELVVVHVLTMMILAALFVVSIAMIAYPGLLRVAFSLAGVSLLLFALLALVIYRLVRKIHNL